MNNDHGTGALAKALAKAQGAMIPPKTDSVNPHFRNRYASLAACLDTARAALSAHGLALVQPTDVIEDGTLVVRTRLMHESGETIESVYPVRPVKQDPQGFGSALTYARRYSLCSLVGIAADDDDDGHSASSGRPPAAAKPSGAPKPSSSPHVEQLVRQYESAKSIDQVHAVTESATAHVRNHATSAADKGRLRAAMTEAEERLAPATSPEEVA